MTRAARETRRFEWAAPAALASLALGCGEDAGSSPADQRRLAAATASAAELCGGVERACCPAPGAPCARGLSCDAGAGVCRVSESETPGAVMLCRSDDDCAAGGRCCSAGMYGTCEALGPSDVCALPDLAVLPSGEGITLLDRMFDGVTPSEGGCVRQRGMRRRVHASVAIANLGAADFILGARDAQPLDAAGVSDDFLRYGLLDASGEVVATSHGPMPCSEGDDPSRSFSCAFAGLPAGALVPALGLECEAVDVTGLPAGAYRLRIELALAWPDADPSNGRVELPVELPPFAPLEPCGAVDAGDLEAFGSSRECGWSRAALPDDGTCNPDDLLWLDCGSCSTTPILRMCAGDDPCSTASAIAEANGFRDATGQLAEPCASIQAACPGIGRYNVMIAAEDPAHTATPCTLTPTPGF